MEQNNKCLFKLGAMQYSRIVFDCCLFVSFLSSPSFLWYKLLAEEATLIVLWCCPQLDFAVYGPMESFNMCLSSLCQLAIVSRALMVLNIFSVDLYILKPK